MDVPLGEHSILAIFVIKDIEVCFISSSKRKIKSGACQSSMCKKSPLKTFISRFIGPIPIRLYNLGSGWLWSL